MISSQKNIQKLKIKNKLISYNSMPYLIAEIGVNHGGSMILAKKMIKQAKQANFSAVKFQTYKAKNLVIKNSPCFNTKLSFKKSFEICHLIFETLISLLFK